MTFDPARLDSDFEAPRAGDATIVWPVCKPPGPSMLVRGVATLIGDRPLWGELVAIE